VKAKLLAFVIVRSKLLAFVIAVLVAVAGTIAFVLVLKGESVAATFIRVGGPTRVETAVEASRFWLAPPERFVATPPDATQETMLAAAECAMLHDAPLLFKAQNPKRRGLFNRTTDAWRRATTAPVQEIEVLGNPDVDECPTGGDRRNVTGLSKLKVANDPLDVPLPELKPELKEQEELSDAVVFVAVKAPATVPDVAVGLALAAHMATVDREVSLVIVPRYLQADPALEAQLRKRHLVKSGLVLGQTGILSEDTRAVLRQIITSTDRRAILGEAQSTLGYIGAVVAALAALLGLGAVAGVATQAVPAFIGFVERSFGPDAPPPGNGPHTKPDGCPAPERSCAVTTHPEGELDWTVGLPDGRRVTVWLRSGWRITGQVKVVADRADAAMRPSFLDLDNAELEREGDRPRQKAGAEKPGMVRVPVDAIELLLSEDDEKPEEPAST
jgi:hypothetical protein